MLNEGEITPDGLERFRSQTAAWLEANCPAEMRGPPSSDGDMCWGGRRGQFTSAAQRLWLERMVARGWTVPEWPCEYGGAGLDEAHARILREEMRRLDCRAPLMSFGISMLGPALLRFGSEAQRREHLPRIARGEIRWCQGYSEPGAGSDLASLATRAEDRGDHFLVNGRKIWTSYADLCDWIFCLVRTDAATEKHRGIGFLLIDMDGPGVTTRPIRLISGKSPFCETLFENVRVPKESLVGPPGGGWEIAKYLLTHERESIGGMDLLTQGATPLHALAVRSIGLEHGRLADGLLRAEIARWQVDSLAFRVTLQRLREEADGGQGLGPLSSVLKYCGTELNKRREDLAVSIAGVRGLLWRDTVDGGAAGGETARAWLRSKGNSIEGGTSEIQLNIIAKHLLGLPGGVRELPMRPALEEERRLLHDSVRKLLDSRSPVAALRELRDRSDADGFDRRLWIEAAELGWSGVLVPEPFGGVELGHAAAGMIAEECGRTLAALPFLSTAVTGVTALVRGGSPPQQARILPAVVAGTRLIALAVDERPRHAPGQISAVAVRDGSGYRLSGRKIFVLDGHVADHLIVSARVGESEPDGAGPPALFLVDAAAAGVQLERTIMIDSRNAADVTLTGVELDAESRLDGGAGDAALLDFVLDAGRAALAAELVGLARECLRRTVQYLGERRQFGRRIGEFQALQHRAAHLFCEIELAASLARAAAVAVQEDAESRPIRVSAAKAKSAEAATLAANEAIQMHGGIGMTDELDIGLFVKRIRSASDTYGDIAFHRDRVARLHGF